MLKTTLYTLGVILTAVGIIGYFNNPIFGIFLVDTTQSTIHVIAGLASLYFGTQTTDQEHLYGRIIAIVYGILALLGISGSSTSFGLAMNGSSSALYLLVTVAFLYVGFGRTSESNYSRHAKA